MERRSVALVVDHPLRDLPGLVLLAARLAREGVTCHLVPSYLRREEVFALAPDFVLVNYLRANNEGFVREAQAAGIRVGVLDNEGGVLSDVEAYARTLARDAAVRDGVACYCSWGPLLARKAVDAGWYRADQVAVTGAPRFDYYAAAYRRAALAMSPAASAYERDLVLVNGNFPLANPQFNTPAAEVEMMVKEFGMDRASVEAWQARSDAAMRGLVSLANALARGLPHATIVYRPHPFERLETYDALLERLPNLHLVREGAVDGWILRARAVVQRGCSTAIEAGLAGVPSLSPAWLPVVAPMPTVEATSIPIATEEEMVQAVARAIRGEMKPPEHVRASLDAVVADWFHRVDGNAHERVAAQILRHASASGADRRLDACRRVSYGRAGGGRSALARAKDAAVDLLGIGMHFSVRGMRSRVPDRSSWDQSDKRFDETAVRGMLRALAQCPGEWKNVEERVGVVATAESGNYHFGYMSGRSVTLYAR